MTRFRFSRKKAAASFNNVASVCTLGHSHRSKLESAVCGILLLRMRAGEISEIQVEDTILLSRAKIKYIVDFRCVDAKTGKTLFVEAKGFANELWPMKKKLWKAYGPAPLEIWMGSHVNPKLVETIIPERGEGEKE